MNEVLSKQIQHKIIKQIQHADVSTLKEIKANYPELHWSSLCYEKTGDTVLHIAARHGYSEIIDYLLKEFEPCMVDIKNKDDKTPLHESAQFAQLNSVLKLCSYGANINALRRGDWTPLMLACTKIHPQMNFKIIQILISKGAKLDVQNKDGWTCVHILAREGDIEIFDFLVDKGMNVTVRTKNGRTALHISALHGHKEFVLKALHFINVNTKDNCGNTALHEAVLGKHIDIVKILIEHGAYIEERNNSDMSLIHLAASQGDIEIIDYVLKHLHFNINLQNKSGWTPLHCTARKGFKGVFEYLKRNGADISLKDNFGRTANDYMC